MDGRAFLARLLDRPRVGAVRAVLNHYDRAGGGLLANALAFSALFAAIPATVLVLGLAGWVAAGDSTIREQVSDALAGVLPPLAGIVRGSVDAVADGAALTSIVGTVGLLWTLSQLFGALDVAFARIYFGAPARGAIRRGLRSLVVVGSLLAVVVAVVTALGLLSALDALSGTAGSVARSTIALVWSPPFLAAAASAAVMIGYRTLPPEPPRWRALLVPATIVGTTLVALSHAFTFLAPWLVSVAELAGSLASVFVALAWLSMSFQVLLLGGAWVRVRNEEPVGRDPGR